VQNGFIRHNFQQLTIIYSFQYYPVKVQIILLQNLPCLPNGMFLFLLFHQGEMLALLNFRCAEPPVGDSTGWTYFTRALRANPI